MTILEQMKDYQIRRTMGFVPMQLEYIKRENGTTVTVIQQQESIRYKDGTFERFMVELPIVKEVA